MNKLVLGTAVCAAIACGWPGRMAQKASAAELSTVPVAATASANADDIVRKLVEENKRRADELKGYTEQREYTVVYHGFPSLKATMTVAAQYEAPSGKQFHILSQSGPKLLVDRVLKKLLESEVEAAKNPAQTALAPANYTFSLAGEQVIDGRQCYVLHVEPKVPSKFLYRGTVFVDAADYAVVRIEAEPAQNPSFWIKKTQVQHTYGKTGQFWLPEHNRSESAVRLGGTAVLTIDYGPYHVQAVPAP